ncbi:hypothetical protein ACFS7Z_08655 [Pontibacter toksunensis]|uniref:Uncharacterized protein n=1 Tax=Pontibacter toksunensis TaxID=1332631 RepID=A0ABW6BTJ2_9BACT
MKNNLFKDIGLKRYMQIKEKHGDNYIEPYYDALAVENGLYGSSLYNKLKPMQKVKDMNYLVAIMDSRYQCIHVGYTESPFTYWISYLKKGTYPYIKDIVILGEGLDNKFALRKAKEMKADLLHLTRKLKIRLALE